MSDLDSLTKEAGTDPAMQVRLVDALIADGRADEAIDMCRRGLSQRADDIPLRLALSRALSAAGHLEEAAAAMMEAAQRGKKAAQKAAPKPAAPKPAAKPVESDFDAAPTRATGKPSRSAFDDDDDDEVEMDISDFNALAAPASVKPVAAPKPARPVRRDPFAPVAATPPRGERHDPTEPTEVVSASEAGASIDLDAIAREPSAAMRWAQRRRRRSCASRPRRPRPPFSARGTSGGGAPSSLPGLAWCWRRAARWPATSINNRSNTKPKRARWSSPISARSKRRSLLMGKRVRSTRSWSATSRTRGPIFRWWRWPTVGSPPSTARTSSRPGLPCSSAPKKSISVDR